MVQVDLAKRYSNFLVPKSHVTVDGLDISQKQGLTLSAILVDQREGEPPKFVCIVDDSQQGAWINSPLFEIGKVVKIEMGYGNILEPVLKGKINVIKTFFSSGLPQIQVYGEAKKPSLPLKNPPTYLLEYGKTLNSFSSKASAEKQVKGKKPAISLRCAAECVGLPEIKPGVILALTGVGNKFNHNYRVEKSTHLWDNQGFRTRFEAEAQIKTPPKLR